MKNNPKYSTNYTQFTGSDGSYRFNLKARNHEIILSSQGYKSKQGRDNGIDSVITNSQIRSRFERLGSKSGEYYFVLKARNGKVIGVSEMYTTHLGRDNGIASVMKHGNN